MSIIERLTRTHADLEAELTQFARMLRRTDPRAAASHALDALRAELEAVHERLELHIASEVSLSERSDFVLGEGAMEEYGVPQHHARMRRAITMLQESLGDEGRADEVRARFQAFVDHFDRYTDAELEFLRENAAVLYPGGSIG